MGEGLRKTSCKSGTSEVSCKNMHRGQFFEKDYWKFFKKYKPLSELTSGIGDIDSDNDIVSVKYYNTQGIEVAAPEYNDGKLYIVVKRYSTGKTDTTKLLNR